MAPLARGRVLLLGRSLDVAAPWGRRQLSRQRGGRRAAWARGPRPAPAARSAPHITTARNPSAAREHVRGGHMAPRYLPALGTIRSTHSCAYPHHLGAQEHVPDRPYLDSSKYGRPKSPVGLCSQRGSLKLGGLSTAARSDRRGVSQPDCQKSGHCCRTHQPTRNRRYSRDFARSGTTRDRRRRP